MGIGDLQELQQPLDGPVLAVAAMQRVEDDVRPHGLEHARDIRLNIDRCHPIATPLEGLHAALARVERHFALGRPPAHEDGDVLRHLTCPQEWPAASGGQKRIDDLHAVYQLPVPHVL